jgi:hypothetical protein
MLERNRLLMLCRQVQQRLSDHQWDPDRYRLDSSLLEHLEKCATCRSLVQAEASLRSDLEHIRQAEVSGRLSFARIRAAAEAGTKGVSSGSSRDGGWLRELLIGSRYRTRRWGVIAVTVGLVVLMAFVPFTFREQIGYEITIAGVDRNIAEDSQDISPLLRALGMEKDKASRLLDSLGADRLHLSVGECRETCQLRISDLKTERDVKLVERAIIALGCCQIDRIVPVFRNESTSVLMYVARKLYS